jgi:uncharacterized protein YndB with AHSA1/START domain
MFTGSPVAVIQKTGPRRGRRARARPDQPPSLYALRTPISQAVSDTQSVSDTARYAARAMSEPPAGINESAPVVSRSEIEIAAPPDAVWDVLTDFERWPSWLRDVKSMSIEGPVAAGTVFRWKAGPGTITSTIQRVERPRLIAWTGRTLGIDAIHFWHFEERDGGTFVRTAESYEGLVARLLRRSLQKTLDRALPDGLQDLKAEVERR